MRCIYSFSSVLLGTPSLEQKKALDSETTCKGGTYLASGLAYLVDTWDACGFSRSVRYGTRGQVRSIWGELNAGRTSKYEWSNDVPENPTCLRLIVPPSSAGRWIMESWCIEMMARKMGTLIVSRSIARVTCAYGIISSDSIACRCMKTAVRLYLFIYLFACSCIYTYAYMYIYEYIWIYMNTYAHTHKYTYTYIFGGTIRPRALSDICSQERMTSPPSIII